MSSADQWLMIYWPLIILAVAGVIFLLTPPG